MSNRAWMPLHIDDYIRDTDHLNASEHGAYLLLIMKYWRDGGLPSDEGLIRRYAKLSPDQWAESRDVIAAFFEEGWHHKRIDAELAKADEIIEKRRLAAKERHSNSKSNASAEQVHSTSPSKCTDTGVPPVTSNFSEPSGSDAAPPVDPRQQLWSEGVSILKAISGKTDGAARQLIGMWSKATKDDCAAIMAKITTAQRERIGDPVSWITAALKPPDKPPKKATQASIWTDEAIAYGIIDEPDSTQDRRLGSRLARGQDQSPGFARRIAGS